MDRFDAARSFEQGAGSFQLPRHIFGYVWRVSAHDQLVLSLLSIVVFLLNMAPLELQRRIVNGAINDRRLDYLLMLCGGYAAVALIMGAIKLWLNIYRAKVGERATKSLREHMYRHGMGLPSEQRDSKAEGVEISVILGEAATVGAFVGESFSEPLLSGGILVSVIGYMLWVQPWIGLVSLFLFAPQFYFVPVMQGAINRTVRQRTRLFRALSVGIIEELEGSKLDGDHNAQIGRAFELNMRVFRLKFTMNFLMNALYHLSIVGVLLIGGWFVIRGETQVGTIVAFTSGLNQLNDPWGDLVNYFRDVTSTQVSYRLIADVLETEEQGSA